MNKTILSLLVASLTFVGVALAQDYTSVIEGSPRVATVTSLDTEDALTISGTTGFIEISATTVATNTLVAATIKGQTAIIINVGTNIITIADGTTFVGSSAAVLSQHDNITVIANAALNWVEISQTDN
jgi:hypothetical protein